MIIQNNYFSSYYASIILQGRRSGAAVRTVASQQEGPGFDSGFSAFLVEFACSPCFCVGSLQVLRFPPTVQKQQANWG